jgi:cobaltochelatase CobN
MHRLAALPGGWNPDTNGTIFIEQNSAPIVIITAADTDIQTLSASIVHFPSDFPSLRVVNLLQLQQQFSIDTYRDRVLIDAKAIVLRLLGGISYWSYGLEILKETVRSTKATLLVLPGDDRPDLELISHSTASIATVNKLWRYFIEGGVENYTNALKFITNLYLNTSYSFVEPKPVSKIGLYRFDSPLIQITGERSPVTNNGIGILFYRAHYLAGNTLAIDALCQELLKRNLQPIPIYVSSLQDEEVRAELTTYLQENNSTNIQLLLNTTSFSLAKLGSEEQPELWKTLNIPILQVILSSSTEEQWESGFTGLTPRDVAMNVALPEVDGRIITRAVSFKSVETWNERLETDVVVYKPRRDRLEFVADLAANWISLQQTSRSQRKIVLILANYPNKDGRIANGVGLDTPASCIEILQAFQEAGYLVENIPKTGDELISRLTAGVTNDLEGRRQKAGGSQQEAGGFDMAEELCLEVEEYQQYFKSLPEKIQKEIIDRWGKIETPLPLHTPTPFFQIPGIQLGNIFVGIQPSRGYDLDPSLNYHAPDLEPTHNYLAYYYWLREKFGAQAIVHVGKHGNLEWLPGKSVALSETCYPEVTLGSIPNFYPFIVNDPGEGSQAKRRSHATIIDHLTPPLTRAELYGSLQKLETLIDEYYEAQTLDPSRLKIISDRITQLVKQENLDRELGIQSMDSNSIAEFLTIADGYLCELKEAQIRDGLHIFGKCPQGKQLRDLIIAIARSPSIDRSGLTQAIAEDLNLDFDPLTADATERFFDAQRQEYPEEAGGAGEVGEADEDVETGIRGNNIFSDRFQKCFNVGDAIEVIEEIAAELVDDLVSSDRSISNSDLNISNNARNISDDLNIYNTDNKNFSPPPLSQTTKQLQWIKNHLLPSLLKTDREIHNLIKGLDGRYVPAGASGAPTRGRPDVLPTGRNFYSVDIRAIPTETAWDVGRKAAEVVIERYTQENGEYPKSLAISIWGTSTMRTGGDDVAQVLALMGVRPIWDGLSRRVVDFEILPTSILGRPRVDVTIRVSGFFRDSFPNLLDLLYKAIEAIASLKEEVDLNPLADRVEKETKIWQREGLDEEKAQQRSLYRIFTSKPGAYGAGLQGLIEAQNWQNDEDLARAYINWSSYAYGAGGKINAAPEAFSDRLKQLEIVLHNQDNREHDLLDSDDYYQFQGGLTAAVRALTGKNPITYFGDNSIPANPKVKLLKEEIAKVYRSRVINPKWIEGVMRHGYKGAFEMAATVDYLFAYDATSRCVEDYIYEGVAQAYLLDEKVQQFIRDRNPWALRDMAERLLEANQRGLWKSVDAEMLDKLKAIANDAEGVIETNAEN